MHDIEPYFKWRRKYIASEDPNSPFFGRQYSEFTFTNKIYNYFIHPQWDNFGSETLYMKLLFADYEKSYAIIELIGEWNDSIGNDIMFLKREVADQLALNGISRYILIAENVLNFHGDMTDYYEEWYDDIADDEGWITILNLQEHVVEEMRDNQVHYYINFGDRYNDIVWQKQKPEHLYTIVDTLVNGQSKLLD